MEFKEFSGKTVDDAITAACQSFVITSDKLEYQVIENGSAGFLGFGAKPAVIKAKIKEENNAPLNAEVKTEVKNVVEAPVDEKFSSPKKEAPDFDEPLIIKTAEEFLSGVFSAMKLDVRFKTEFSASDYELSVELSGEQMGVLIGKRGQTLDSLQYLTSLVVNKVTASYIRVKVDTEDYRSRRKETLENLAKNISFKVKRTKRPVSLEPMNPYERRIIHSALQDDNMVTTHSEGDEPFRRVVVTLAKKNRR